MSDASSQAKKVEKGVHVSFAERIKRSANNVGSTSTHEPPESGRGIDGRKGVEQWLHGYQDATTHADVASCLQVAMLFQLSETQYKPDDGGQPYKSENAPAPTTGMTHHQQCERSVSACNVQVDGSVVEFAEQLFHRSRTGGVIPGGTDIGREHSRQIDRNAGDGPMRIIACGCPCEQEVSGNHS